MSAEAQYQLLRDKIKAAEEKAATWEQHWRRALEKYNAAEFAFIEARSAMYKVQLALLTGNEVEARHVLAEALISADKYIISERKPVTG